MITITHTHADGTMLEGSSKGDGVYELLKGLRDNWRYFPSIRAIGIGQSRDKSADSYKINRAAEALRAAGHEVTVTVDETERRSFAEAEAERYESAEARAERMAGYAANAAARSDAAYQRSHQIADGIPFGQPILVGHHSERRHRKDLDRIHNLMGKSIAEGKAAEHYEHRAANAETYQASRESVPVTLRRIEKLAAEERQLQRRLDGSGLAMHGEDKPASGGYAERLAVRLADIAEQLAYWRGVVASQEAAGVKVWSKADFTKGDYVHFIGSWYEVLRVNPKSLTIPAMINDGVFIKREGARCTWTDTMPYDKVTGRKSAEEIAEIIAEADRREQATA